MENNKDVNISGVRRDVIGVDVSGSGNIIGKYIHLGGGSNYVFAQKIKALEVLQRYYRVDPSGIINIRDLKVKEIRNWVENWHSTSGEAKKPIYLITGDPGIGKSWLVYRLVYELMNEGYNVSVISKPPLLSGSHPTSYDDEDNDNSKDIKKSIFAIDDRGTTVGERSTLIGLDDIYEIVKGNLPSGLPQSLEGPIILSISEENWSYIVNGASNKEKLNELVLEEEVVEKDVIPKLEYEQSEKIVKSFYTEVDGNTPRYPNLVVNEEVKSKIIERSNGIPVVVKLFFDHKASNMADNNKNKNVVLTKLDAEEIISNSKDYALKQLFNYYLNEMNHNRQRDKVSNVLAFLYFIAKQGFISIGHLICIRDEKMKEQDYLLLEQVWNHLDLLNYKRPLPLFNINDVGILVPFHDIVSEAIVSLVEDPKGLQSRISKDQKDIINKVRLIEGIDLDNDISIKEKSENDFITPYKDSIIKSMDYFLERRLYRQIERHGTISNESAYNFMSIFIELLIRRKDFEFDTEIKENFVNKFKAILEKREIKDYLEMEINIHKQLESIFGWLKWLEFPIEGFKQYYVDLLKSKSKDVRTIIWLYTTNLIKNKVMTGEELRPLKENFFELLKSKEHWIRLVAGTNIYKLIYNEVITGEDRKIFLDLFNNSDERMRSDAWRNMSYLIEFRVITGEELRPLKEKLFELLYSTDERIRKDAWENIYYLIKNKVITVQELRPLKEKLFELLYSTDERIRKDAWENIYYLIKNKEITEKEKRLLKVNFLKLLYSTDERIRKDAWENIPLIEKNDNI